MHVGVGHGDYESQPLSASFKALDSVVDPSRAALCSRFCRLHTTPFRAPLHSTLPTRRPLPLLPSASHIGHDLVGRAGGDKYPCVREQGAHERARADIACRSGVHCTRIVTGDASTTRWFDIRWTFEPCLDVRPACARTRAQPSYSNLVRVRVSTMYALCIPH